MSIVRGRVSLKSLVGIGSKRQVDDLEEIMTDVPSAWSTVETLFNIIEGFMGGSRFNIIEGFMGGSIGLIL